MWMVSISIRLRTDGTNEKLNSMTFFDTLLTAIELPMNTYQVQVGEDDSSWRGRGRRGRGGTTTLDLRGLWEGRNATYLVDFVFFSSSHNDQYIFDTHRRVKLHT